MALDKIALWTNYKDNNSYHIIHMPGTENCKSVAGNHNPSLPSLRTYDDSGSGFLYAHHLMEGNGTPP